MPKKCLKRIVVSTPVLIGAVLIIFIMLRIIPGNPATTMLREHANQAVIDKVSREVGLDQPLYMQFFRCVDNALKGGLGTSYRLNRNVAKIILEVFPSTAELSVCTAVVARVVGVTIGIVAAVKQNKLLDRLFMGYALVGVSMPVFMTTLVLQYMFTFKPKLFSVSGYGSLICMALLATVLGWNSTRSIVGTARSSLVEAIQGDYIQIARTKGLREWGVIVHHTLRNAILSVIIMVALQVSSMFSGTVLAKNVFGILGIGRLAVNAIETGDMPLLQSMVIFTTILVIVGNLVADMLYSVLDPRIGEGA